MQTKTLNGKVKLNIKKQLEHERMVRRANEYQEKQALLQLRIKGIDSGVPYKYSGDK